MVGKAVVEDCMTGQDTVVRKKAVARVAVDNHAVDTTAESVADSDLRRRAGQHTLACFDLCIYN